MASKYTKFLLLILLTVSKDNNREITKELEATLILIARILKMVKKGKQISSNKHRDETPK